MRKIEVPRRRLWTPRPEVTMENYKEVFNFYDQYGGPNPQMVRVGHALFGRMYPVRIDIAPDDAQTIHDALGQGRLAFLMLNHRTKEDQFNLASMVQRLAALRAMRARSVILARFGLFNEPGLKGDLQRLGIDAMGSIPAFRAKDREGDDEEKVRLQRNASDSTLQLGHNKTDRDGFNMVGYPENERLLEGQDPSVLRKLSRGFGLMYENLGVRYDPIIITAAHFAGEGDERDEKNAVVSIGPPVTDRLSSAAEFDGAVATNLQRDLTRASGLWVPVPRAAS